MKKYIPYEKLSKKKQRELDRKQRITWGSLSPVTRNTANPKAYNRKKARKWDRDDYPAVPFSLHKKSPTDLSMRLSALFHDISITHFFKNFVPDFGHHPFPNRSVVR